MSLTVNQLEATMAVGFDLGADGVDAPADDVDLGASGTTGGLMGPAGGVAICSGRMRGMKTRLC